MAGIAISSRAAASWSTPFTVVASKCSRPRADSSRLRSGSLGNGRSVRNPESGRGFLGHCAPIRGLSSRVSRALQSPEEKVEEVEEQQQQVGNTDGEGETSDNGTTEKRKAKSAPINNELNQVVMKTAATFAPRASTASKNPAPPGSTLYKVFEAQAYVAMVLGGALSFNLLFPSDHPDLWRLMGMWSVWMFTVPSLRARDCSKNEKQALNYLFLAIPLINVTLPLVWKSFAAVWSADIVAFFAIYAWKMEWLSGEDKNVEDS